MAGINISYGETLFLQRRRLGLSQSEMARAISATRTKYGRWERDQEECRLACPPLQDISDTEIATIKRRREGVTQKDVAKELNVSRYWVSQMETGQAGSDRLTKYWDSE